MYPLVLFMLLLNGSSGCDNQCGKNSGLVYAAVIARHGSRSPIATFPTDQYPYNDIYYWPNGADELTKLGRQQCYELGKRLRGRYKNFIDDIYRPNETTIFVYNSVNRVQASAALIAAGLYPPAASQVWSTQLPWQPVIMTKRPLNVCQLVWDENLCPAFHRTFLKQASAINRRSNEYKELLEYLSVYTGLNMTSELALLYIIYDVLKMQSENGFTLPAWADSIMPDLLQPIATNLFLEMLVEGPNQISLAAGPELETISQLFEDKVNGKEKSKLYIETGHDCTLALLLRSMGFNITFEIETAAHIIFELITERSRYYVKVYYFRTVDDTSPIDITIAGCANPCPLKDFVEFVNRIKPTNWIQACQ